MSMKPFIPLFLLFSVFSYDGSGQSLDKICTQAKNCNELSRDSVKVLQNTSSSLNQEENVKRLADAFKLRGVTNIVSAIRLNSFTSSLYMGTDTKSVSEQIEKSLRVCSGSGNQDFNAYFESYRSYLKSNADQFPILGNKVELSRKFPSLSSKARIQRLRTDFLIALESNRLKQLKKTYLSGEDATAIERLSNLTDSGSFAMNYISQSDPIENLKNKIYKENGGDKKYGYIGYQQWKIGSDFATQVYDKEALNKDWFKATEDFFPKGGPHQKNRPNRDFYDDTSKAVQSGKYDKEIEQTMLQANKDYFDQASKSIKQLCGLSSCEALRYYEPYMIAQLNSNPNLAEPYCYCNQKQKDQQKIDSNIDIMSSVAAVGSLVLLATPAAPLSPVLASFGTPAVTYSLATKYDKFRDDRKLSNISEIMTTTPYFSEEVSKYRKEKADESKTQFVKEATTAVLPSLHGIKTEKIKEVADELQSVAIDKAIDNAINSKDGELVLPLGPYGVDYHLNQNLKENNIDSQFRRAEELIFMDMAMKNKIATYPQDTLEKQTAFNVLIQSTLIKDLNKAGATQLPQKITLYKFDDKGVAKSLVTFDCTSKQKKYCEPISEKGNPMPEYFKRILSQKKK